MMNIKHTIATFLLLTAGAFTFISCTDEDDVLERGSLSKSGRVENLSKFEENRYSAEEIFAKTAEFSKQLKNGAVKDITISDAVVIMETFWNYGVVAKQEITKGERYSSQNFSFRVPLTDDGNIIKGAELETAFKKFITSVKANMNGKVLNTGDMSVVYYDGSSVVFNLRILPFSGLTDMLYVDDDVVGAKTYVFKHFGETITVPDTVSFDPNLLPAYTFLEDSAFIYAMWGTDSIKIRTNFTSWMEYCKERRLGAPVNLMLKLADNKDTLWTSVLDAFVNPGDMFCIYPKKPIQYYSAGHYCDYYTKDNEFIADTLLQSVLYTMDSTLGVSSGYYIKDCDFYAYRMSGTAPTTNAYFVPPASEYTKFMIRNITICQLKYVVPPIVGPIFNQIEVTW